MEYRKLHGTDIELSVLGMGCSSYWAKDSIPEEIAIKLLHRAYSQGINFFDTGSSYAAGNAERRLGKFVATVDRNSVVISTKAGTVSASHGNATKDFSPTAIRESVEGSLVRLGVGYVDILFLHSPTVEELSSGLYRELDLLIKENKIRYAGVHSSSAHVINAVRSIGCFSVFLADYNLMRASFESTIDSIEQCGKGFIAATPLAQMLFTNKIYFPTNRKGLWYLARALKTRRKQLVNGLMLRFAGKVPNVEPEAVAIQYVLNNPNVTSAVFGTTQETNIDKNVSSINATVPSEVFLKIQTTKLPFPN